LKDTDDERHEANTGVPLQGILHNLRVVDAAGGRTVLRCVMVSGVNLFDEHIHRIGEIYQGLHNCLGVELLPYHALGNSKYEKLGMDYHSPAEWTPSLEQMEHARGILRADGAYRK
jgi:pyruvate formate lyase activating enzyme